MVVWDATHGLFLASKFGVADISTSPTGAAWTSRALTGANSGSHAVLSSGRGCSPKGGGSSITFDTSTNGTTWAASGGTLPDIANAGGNPAVAAVANTFYVATYFNSQSQLRIHSSPDASTWTLVATIDVSWIATPTSSPYLLADPYSKSLYALVAMAGGDSTYAFASMDNGATWLTPAWCHGPGNSLRAAGGRLFSYYNGVFRCTVNRLPAAP